MKKATKITLGIIGGLVVLGTIINIVDPPKPASNTATQSAPEQSRQSNQPEQKAPAPTPEKVTISNTKYQEDEYMRQVIGEATNKDTVKHTPTIKATFYDVNGKIMGTAIGLLKDLEPGVTKTFNLYTNDNVTGYKDMKVQVDALL